MVRARQDQLVGWFRELRAPLRRFLRSRRGVPHSDLDDVAQEVFLRLLRFDRSELITQPKAYLFKMAANVASEWGMRACRHLPHDSEWLSELSTGIDLDDELQRETRDGEIARAINELSPRARSILQLHFGEGLTHEAIAGRLQLTRRIVKRECIRAYAALRVSLESERPIREARE